MSRAIAAPGRRAGGNLLLAALCGALLVACTSAAPAAKPAATSVPTAAPAPTAASAPTAAAAPAAAAPTAAREPTLLRITDLQITSSAGNYIASAKGYFQEEGIRAELVQTPGGDITALLVSGQVQVAAGTISSGLYNAFGRGVSAKIVADHGANLQNASASGFVMRKDLYDSGALRGPADLKGRKMGGGTVGSSPDVLRDRLLSAHGLTPADIELVTLANLPDFIPAFENRAIDAAIYQEPLTTIAVERGLIARGPIGYDIYPNQQIGAILFGDRVLGDRALAVGYMRAYVRGVRDYVRAMIERDPAAFEEVVPILIEHTTVKDRALFEKAVPSGLKADPIPNVQSITDDQEWYLTHGFQNQRVNMADFIDTGFVEQAIRELGPARR